MNVKANLHHFRLSNSGLISLSINYSAFPEPPSEPGAAEWYQFHFPACSLANTVAEIGEFSHFAFQFKGKFLLSISCINSMLLSKTFIGLARTIKSRYSFQWQYLELICSHFELRQPVAIWDVGLVKRIGSIHHWHLQRSRTVPGDPWAQELQGWAGKAEMNPGQSLGQGLSHGIFTHMEQAAGLRLQGSSSHRFMSHLHNLAHLHQPWLCKETSDTPGSALRAPRTPSTALGWASVHLLARNAKPALFPHFPREKNKYITEPNAFQHQAKRAGDGSVVLLSLLQYHHYCSPKQFLLPLCRS